MTIEAVYRGGHFVPKEALELEEGTEVQISIPQERSEVEQEMALDRLFATLSEIAKDANPNFVWSRDLAYDFDDEE